jgi:hypothetical protein
MAAADRGRESAGIELADAAHRENGRLNPVLVEELDQSPDANATAELTLGQLHGRLIVETAQEHGIEVRREVDGNARAIGPDRLFDSLMTVTQPSRCGLEVLRSWAVGHASTSVRPVIAGSLARSAPEVECPALLVDLVGAARTDLPSCGIGWV